MKDVCLRIHGLLWYCSSRLRTCNFCICLKNRSFLYAIKNWISFYGDIILPFKAQDPNGGFLFAWWEPVWGTEWLCGYQHSQDEQVRKFPEPSTWATVCLRMEPSRSKAPESQLMTPSQGKGWGSCDGSSATSCLCQIQEGLAESHRRAEAALLRELALDTSMHLLRWVIDKLCGEISRSSSNGRLVHRTERGATLQKPKRSYCHDKEEGGCKPQSLYKVPQAPAKGLGSPRQGKTGIVLRVE